VGAAFFVHPGGALMRCGSNWIRCLGLFACATVALVYVPSARAVPGTADTVAEYITTITKPAAGSTVTPDPTTGYFPVEGTVKRPALGKKVKTVRITLTPKGQQTPETADSRNTTIQDDPNNPRTIIYKNPKIKSTKSGEHEPKAQPLDDQGNPLGDPAVITIYL
jgi:hypothetical protein